MMKTEETAGKTWERTKTKGLLRHKGGRYYGRFTLSGKTNFVPLETSLLEIARTRFAEHKARVEGMRKAARASKEGVATMGDLYALYVSAVKARTDISEATRRRYLESASYITKTWPGFLVLRPDEIKKTVVLDWRNRALSSGTSYKPPGAKVVSRAHSGKSPTSFNKAVDALRSMLEPAVESGAIRANPFSTKGLKASYKPRKPKLPESATLNAVFQEVEKGSGVAGRGLEAADFLRFLAFTGCRLSEAGAVRWCDVDFNKGIIKIAGTKTDAANRETPMIPAAIALLEKVFERRKRNAIAMVNGEPLVDDRDKVFHFSEAQRSLDRACAKLGIDRLTHHDFRDAFATTAIESGVDIPTVAGWLGHVDGGALLMKTYNHLRNEHSKTQAAKVTFGGTT